MADPLLALGIVSLVALIAGLIWWDVRHPMTPGQDDDSHNDSTLW